ncbi:hypothetical protein ACIRFH_18650 [Streptomyces sp. NPDC093586]|uniref:hypothetical protein n=1 Tax=Streptomyces sp. NPDC093586 TaxID=3366042 RepID=UPI0037FE22E7
MGFEGEVWHVRGRTDAKARVGEILIEDADFPWLSGRFTPGPAYDAVRDLFVRELALAERDDDGHGDEWEATCDEIGARVSLVSPDGPVAEFLLHIDGDRAWFRWSEEPFGSFGSFGDRGGDG